MKRGIVCSYIIKLSGYKIAEACLTYNNILLLADLGRAKLVLLRLKRFNIYSIIMHLLELNISNPTCEMDEIFIMFATRKSDHYELICSNHVTVGIRMSMINFRNQELGIRMSIMLSKLIHTRFKIYVVNMQVYFLIKQDQTILLKCCELLLMIFNPTI